MPESARLALNGKVVWIIYKRILQRERQRGRGLVVIMKHLSVLYEGLYLLRSCGVKVDDYLRYDLQVPRGRRMRGRV